MDPTILQEFLKEHRSQLEGALVRRVQCAADGLIFELSGEKPLELAFLGVRGAAWAYVLQAGDRNLLLQEMQNVAPELVGEIRGLDGSMVQATALDALRAWLLRPAPRAPEWFLLENARLVGMHCRSGERILHCAFQKVDRLGRASRLSLTVELFDRAMNLLLTSAVGESLANWTGRRPAGERLSPEAERTAVGQENRSCVDATAAANDMGALQPSLVACAHLALAQASSDSTATTRRQARRREEKRLRHLVRHLERDLERSSSAATWRRWGELLTANLHQVRKGQSRVVVEDFYEPGRSIAIELDPQLSPQENARVFFKRARRGERGREIVATRLDNARGQLDRLRADASAEAQATTWDQILRETPAIWNSSVPSAEHQLTVESLWQAGGPAWKPSQPPQTRALETRCESSGPGRIFVLPGEWEIRVGRSNEENDLLTHRFARPNDVWLHASGVAGSHVVLRMLDRKGNPPREILQTAAAIAARFSKAKHAGTVPVVWTRKRYVRKPRGSKPGLAVCTHEKTVFVRPGLPQSDEESDA